MLSISNKPAALRLLGASSSRDGSSSTDDLYDLATSPAGLSALQQYWESHSSTYPRLPPAALLNPAACPRGLSGAALVHVLGQVTGAEPWALWDLAGLLDTRRCGFVGCQQFMLAVVLLCAAASGKQLQALFACRGALQQLLASPGGHSTSHQAVRQCCMLLGVSAAALRAAERQLPLHNQPQQQQQQKQQQQQQQQMAGRPQQLGMMGPLVHLLPDTRFQQHKQQQQQQQQQQPTDQPDRCSSAAFSELLLYSAVTQHLQRIAEEQQLQQTPAASRGATAGPRQVLPIAAGTSRLEDEVVYAGAPSRCWCF